jgi:adenine-specific DNA-methyltransferase
VYVSNETGRITKIGDPLGPDEPLSTAPQVNGSVAVFPIREDGLQMEWGLTGSSLRRSLDQGFVRVTSGGHENQPYVFSYLTAPNIKKIDAGDLLVTGTRDDGSKVVVLPEGRTSRPTTVWQDRAHDAGAHGTSLLGAMTPGRRFPFPKSLYAVEDMLRFFVRSNPDAVVLDFFGGSGTTTHAVARLNRQDGGRRQSILVTNKVHRRVPDC